jgi:undecaprenyl-diphosphatase
VALPDVHLLVKMKTSFSMPSAHAANFFALATYFTYFYRRYKWWFYSAAFMVALSRVSVGVHYPFDIAAGALLGVLCALLVTGLWQYTNAKYFHISASSKE